jgi:hypothetical protein
MTTIEKIETFLDSLAQLEPEEQVRRVREMMKDPTNTPAAYLSVKLAKWIGKMETYL